MGTKLNVFSKTLKSTVACKPVRNVPNKPMNLNL